MSTDLDEEQLRALFTWIDAIPLSRPKRNIARDFSDGVLLAEVVHAYFPHLVELHNYPSTSSIKQKMYNFETLNKKVLKKLGYVISRELIEETVNCKAGAIEQVLNALQIKMAKYREKRLSIDTTSVSSSGRAEQRQQLTQSNDGACKSINLVGVASTNNSRNYRADSQPLQTLNEQLLMEKDDQLKELQETVQILELKVSKLEQLVRLKDLKIQKLTLK